MRYRTHVYQDMIEEAAQCRLCPNMNFEKVFLNIHNGNLKANMFFVGEGPSLGYEWDAKPTPMANSRSGDNFDKYLSYAGIHRYDVFVTNAVLHTPVTDAGKGMSPTENQFMNCSGFISRLIDLIQPIVVIALGSKALGALSQIEPHTYKLSSLVGTMQIWNGRFITALYHPSPNTLTMRSSDEQIRDYKRLVDLVNFRSKRK